jgi:amino acid transporter
MSTTPAVEVHEAEFRKVLGLRDLVLTQILNVVGLGWVGVAAKLGPSHVFFWLLAVVSFYLPSAAVVIYLNRLRPLEGGLYVWARDGFSEFVGFMTAWNIWLNAVVLISEIGIQSITVLSYVTGPELASNRWITTGASCLLILALMLVTSAGMDVGRWVNGAGGVILLVIFAALIALPFRNLASGRLPEYHPFALAMPTASLMSLNILAKISFGALSGFDYVAIFAGECKDAARSIGRSVIIAAPIIALMFILGTSAVRAFVPADKLDLVSPISQTLSMGTIPSDPGARLIPLVILGILACTIAQQNVSFAGTSRLPLVAGWDHLLPRWFTRLHPKRRTPTNSIVFVGAITLGIGLASLIGVGNQEAYQFLQNTAGVFYAFAYLVMFALPLFGFRHLHSRPPLWLKAASASGLLMTLLSVILSIFPVVEVVNRMAFMLKVASLIAVTQFLGAAIFLAYRRRGADQSVAARSADS